MVPVDLRARSAFGCSTALANSSLARLNVRTRLEKRVRDARKLVHRTPQRQNMLGKACSGRFKARKIIPGTSTEKAKSFLGRLNVTSASKSLFRQLKARIRSSGTPKRSKNTCLFIEGRSCDLTREDCKLRVKRQLKLRRKPCKKSSQAPEP